MFTGGCVRTLYYRSHIELYYAVHQNPHPQLELALDFRELLLKLRAMGFQSHALRYNVGLGGGCGAGGHRDGGAGAARHYAVA